MEEEFKLINDTKIYINNTTVIITYPSEKAAEESFNQMKNTYRKMKLIK